jgi:hypothetical protein
MKRKDIETTTCQFISKRGKDIHSCQNEIQYNINYPPPKYCFEHSAAPPHEEQQTTLRKSDLELLAECGIFPRKYYKKDGSFQDWVKEDPPYLKNIQIDFLFSPKR